MLEMNNQAFPEQRDIPVKPNPCCTHCDRLCFYLDMLCVVWVSIFPLCSLSSSLLAHLPLISWFVFCCFRHTVCSSPPVNMKVQPLNRTALVVSWTPPQIVYHPPIISFMISYSSSKNEESYEITKDSHQELVRPPLGLLTHPERCPPSRV